MMYKYDYINLITASIINGPSSSTPAWLAVTESPSAMPTVIASFPYHSPVTITLPCDPIT